MTVQISKGNVVDVPNVVGKTEEAAREILDNQGFKVNVVEGDTAPEDKVGRVQSQSPEGGKQLAKGETVNIVIYQAEPQESPTPSPTPTDSGSPPPGLF